MKYIITQSGYDEFVGNKKKYLQPTVEAKLIVILSSRVGYTLDSLNSLITMDPRLKATEGKVFVALDRLKELGYVEVIG